MTQVAAEERAVHRLPAVSLYWCVLDLGALPGGGVRRPSTEQLGFLMERHLPLPLESVHAVYVPLGDDHVLACAIEVEMLRKKLAGEPDLAAVVPDVVPSIVAPDRVAHVDPTTLNLLVGPYAPKSVRRRQRRATWETLAFLALACFAVLVGAERRMQALREEADRLLGATDSVLRRVVASVTNGASGAQPAELRLLAEVRRLDQTRVGSGGEMTGLARPADRDFESLLRQWPRDLHTSTETITVTGSSLTVRVIVPFDEVEQLTRAFQAWDDWTLRQPEVANRPEGAVVTIQFQRPDNSRGGA